MVTTNRIDLFQQIKEFDYLCLTTLNIKGMTGNYRSVYFSLLSINNSKYWAEVFEVDFQHICDLSCVDKDTYRRAKDFLYSSGLFESYQKGINKYARAKVSLKILTENSTGNKVANKDAIPVGNTDGIKAASAHNFKTVNNETLNSKKIEVVEKTRLEKFTEAIDGYFESLPLIEEKEKNSAKKEKEIPTLEVAIARMTESTMWRNVIQHYKISESDREKLFKVFYEQKEDSYRISYPTWPNMCSNFYYWISTIKQLGKLKLYLNPNGTETNAFDQNTNKSGTRNHTTAKNERSDLTTKSAEFLRQFAQQIVNPGHIQQ